jgi:uncharacterized protein (DUF2225 family)
MTDDDAPLLRCPNCLHASNDVDDVEVYSRSETEEHPQVWICSRCDFVGVYEDFKGLTSVQRQLF